MRRLAFKALFWTTASIALAAAPDTFARPQQNQPAGGDNLKQLTLEQLANTQVTTASREPTALQETPVAVYVLTQEDIRRSGATSIPEVLRLVPGVEVSRINSSFWSVGIRGFGSRLSKSVLVLIDGRSVYTPLFAGVYWEVQDTLLDDIDRIEVIRGPGGTIWGPNAVNGVINIITKNSENTQGLLVKAGGGSVDQGTLDLRYGGHQGSKFDYRVYGKGFVRGSEFHRNADNFDDWRMAQGGFRTDWRLNDHNLLTVQGDTYSGDVGTSLGITTYSPPIATNLDGHSLVSGSNLTAHWDRTTDSGSDVQLLAYFDRTNRHDQNFAEIRNTGDIDLTHRFSLPRRQRVTWGAGMRLSSSDTTVVVPTVVFLPNDEIDKLYTAFVQDEVSLINDKLVLTIGSKFLHNNYTGFEFEPSARVSWTPIHHQTFWAAVSRAVRTPARTEEGLQFTAAFIPSLPAFIRLTGDGDFSSERLLGYELGYRGVLSPKVFVDVSSFFNDYDHLLSVEAHTPFVEASPSPIHIILPVLERNLVQGSTSGVEVAPSWDVTGRWRLKGNYSFLHMDLERKPGSVDGSTVVNTEGSSPGHQVALESLLSLPKYVEFDVDYRYVSALPAQAVAAYHTADVRLGWNPLESVEFSISGENLLQPHHLEFGGGVEIKRSAYAKITWRR